MERIILNQISNPGISFTKDVNEKMLTLYDYISSNNNMNCSYQDFQDNLISNNIFTGSYIRSFIPFLFNSGMINDYTNGIKYNNFFTKNGLLYIKTINNLKNADENNIDLSKLTAIKNDLLCLSLDYMLKNNYKFIDKYLDILEFVKKYKTINREEFYIMEYCIQNNIDYENYIEQYRNDNQNFEIMIKTNNDEILSYRSNNAFNYLIAFLAEEQCNYVIKYNQGDYMINKNREEFVDSILNQSKKENGYE